MGGSLQTSRAHARRIWWAGVQAADPGRLVQDAIRQRSAAIELAGVRFALEDIDSILVVGGGKAGAPMSAALERALGRRILKDKRVRGWVHVPDRSVRTLRAIHLHGARARSENQPTAPGEAGTKRIGALLDSLGRRDLVICLLSGGASALLPAPAPGIRLSDKQAVTARLLECGATIEEVNAVRKHLSWLKGGGLVRRAKDTPIVSLILSDVIRDRLDVIASGPTARDPTTFAQAIQVLRDHGLWTDIPASVKKHLEEGAAGRKPETLKRLPRRVHNFVIGGNQTALDGAAQAARDLGYRVIEHSSRLDGEAARAGEALAKVARRVARGRDRASPAVCILSGGETTVRVGPGAGKGGRNQELVLAAGNALSGSDLEEIVFLSGGTDGEDGPTDAAGAWVDRGVWQKALGLGLDPADHLARHDAYHFFDPAGGLLRTGLTGTNVMDLQVILVGA